jgi:hypothetical protein
MEIGKIDFNKYLNEPGGRVAAKNAGSVGATKGGYDLQQAKAAFAEFNRQVDQVVSAIQGFEIQTDDDAAGFTETVGAAKRIIQAIESKRKLIISEADSFVRSVNAFVRRFRKKVEDVEKLGKRKIGEYNYKKEIDRREAEKKMQEAAALKQAEIDAAAKKAGVESVTLPPVMTPQKVEPIRTESATGSTRFKKVFEVVDFSQLDDEYKIVDGKKLQAAIDAGMRPAGVKIKEVPIVTIRNN